MHQTCPEYSAWGLFCLDLILLPWLREIGTACFLNSTPSLYLNILLLLWLVWWICISVVFLTTYFWSVSKLPSGRHAPWCWSWRHEVKPVLPSPCRTCWCWCSVAIKAWWLYQGLALACILGSVSGSSLGSLIQVAMVWNGSGSSSLLVFLLLNTDALRQWLLWECHFPAQSCFPDLHCNPCEVLISCRDHHLLMLLRMVPGV